MSPKSKVQSPKLQIPVRQLWVSGLWTLDIGLWTRTAMRLLYRFYCLFSGGRYWAQRRFTRAGWFVLCALIAAALMSLDTENSVAYQGFALLLFVLLVAAAFSWFFRGRFSATRLLPRFGTVGHPLDYQVMVRNLTPKPQAGLTLLEELADP